MRRLAATLLLAACGNEPVPPTELTHSVYDLALSDDAMVAVDASGSVHVGGTPIPLPSGSSDSTTPIALVLPAATAAAVGEKHACVLSGGNALCWGDAENAKLGAHRGCYATGEYEQTTCASAPDVLPNLRALESIAAGDTFTCAIDEDGRVFCWGDRAGGRLGGSDVPALDPPTPVTLPGEAKRLIVAHGTACALLPNGAFTAGEAWCWGEGYGSPTKLKLDGVVDLAIGARHTCAITVAGGLQCWGANHNGESGDVASAHRCGTAPGPCEVSATKITLGASEPVRVVVGERHSCALNAAGQVYCWGSNEVGQLGRDDAFLIGDVGLVMDGVVDLASSYARVCATTASDRAWCWGEFETEANY